MRWDCLDTLFATNGSHSTAFVVDDKMWSGLEKLSRSLKAIYLSEFLSISISICGSSALFYGFPRAVAGQILIIWVSSLSLSLFLCLSHSASHRIDLRCCRNEPNDERQQTGWPASSNRNRNINRASWLRFGRPTVAANAFRQSVALLRPNRTQSQRQMDAARVSRGSIFSKHRMQATGLLR